MIADSPLWREWSRRFVQSNGRVVDTANYEVSHSEGQGYGMLLAAAAGDRDAFDRIWRWTRDNLSGRPDNLFAWRWDPVTHAVSDHNNATDGDILIAWALAEAADLWEDPKYTEAGAAIARDVARLAVVEVADVGSVLLPATYGFTSAEQSDGPVVNLSYWIFPAFARLAQLAPDKDWDAVKRTGLAILDAIQSQNPGIVTNWTGLSGAKAAPARRFPALSGYDSFRIPLHLAFSQGENRKRLHLFDKAGYVSGQGGVPVLNLRTGQQEEFARGRGYNAISALRACSVAGEPYPREFYWLGEKDAYYPATLHMLAIVAALTSASACLDPVETRALQPVTWKQRLAEDLPQTRPVVAKPASVPAHARKNAAAAEPAVRPARDLIGVAAFSGVALAFFGFLFVTRSHRKTGAPAFQPSAAAPEPKFALKSAPESPSSAAPAVRDPTAPRCLPQNPFLTARGQGAVEQRLDIAAHASRQWRRTAAVAFFRLSDFDAIAASQGRDVAERVMAEIVEGLSGRIRKSDAVASLAQDEIAVCLSLIADQIDLDSVGRRLTVALRMVHPEVGGGDNLFGLALYPAEEGFGAECLAEARRAFEMTLPQSEPQPKLRRMSQSQPKSKPQAKKTARTAPARRRKTQTASTA
ncbi:MAG: glycosyl hydrolase family 8 [Rhodoblastus sp.]